MFNDSASFSSLVRREVRNFFQNKPFAYLIIVGPLLLAIVMVSILWNGVMLSIPIAVWDGDNSAQSRELAHMLAASPYLEVVEHVDSKEAGYDLIKKGQVNAIFIIPQDFAHDILSGVGATVLGRYNNQFLTQGGTINKVFTEVVMTFAAKYDAVKYMSRGIPVSSVGGYVRPISVSNHLLYNESINYSWFLLLGMIPVIWQLLGIGGVIYMLGTDLGNREQELLKYAKSEKWWLLPGKLLPYVALFCVQFVVLLIIMFCVVRIPLNGSILAILLGSFLFILATVSMGALLVSILRDVGMSTSGASIYVSPAFAYAGATFPYEAMPYFAKVWSGLLPITHYHQLLVDIALRDAPMNIIMQPIAVLSLFIIVALPLATYLYRYQIMKYAGDTV